MKQILSLSSFLIILNCFGQNALDFDGTNDVVQTTYEGVLGSTNRTFEAWIYVSADAPASNLAILDYGQNAVGSRNTFLVGGDRSLRYLSGGVDANIGTGADVIPEEEWTHVAFVLNSGTGYLYVNGVEEGTGSLTTVDTPSGEADMTIGQRVSGGSLPFYGIIDEVRIWDVARTSDEILGAMNTEQCMTEGLVAYYRFNQGVAGGVNIGVVSAIEEISGNDGDLNDFALTGLTSNWVLGADLEAAPSYSITNTFTECAGFSVTVGDNTYTTTGEYTDVFSGVLTCDSIIITDLTILPYGVNDVLIAECTGFSITLNGTSYDETGYYTDTLTAAAANGCDSIILLDLTIYEEAINDLVINECEGYSIIVNGTTYDATGEYTETVIGGGLGGCDSIINLDLTISDHIINDLTISECEGYTITVNGTEYNSTGVYSETIIGGAVSGCDSIINLDLTVAGPVDVTTTVDGLTITANNASATYQWIDCNTMMELPGETDQSLTVTENGDYAVIITEGGCSDTSDCITYTNVGLKEISQQSSLTVYPNPASENITIETANSGSATVSIYSLLGKVAIEQVYFEDIIALDIQDLPAGSYIIEVSQDDKKERHFFVKQ
ncbi:MAG: T9SS type A sorting domain-containing protein [Crocinitomix sp.]|nr:T9SS type A sorting domain-containing protein [Crocinitomix sp.]